MERIPKPLTHLNNKWKKLLFNSGMEVSVSLKCQAFLSLQTHQKTQWGTTLHTKEVLLLPLGPCQHERRSKTVLGITHWTPNKTNTKSHNSRASLQCRRIWSGLSPLSLHKQHQSTKIMPRLRRLSIVKIFPSAAVHEKKATRGRALDFHTHFQGKI